MRGVVPMLAAAVVLAPAIVLALAGDQNPPPLPGWHETVAPGLAEARASGRPVLVVFR